MHKYISLSLPAVSVSVYFSPVGDVGTQVRQRDLISGTIWAENGFLQSAGLHGRRVVVELASSSSPWSAAFGSYGSIITFALLYSSSLTRPALVSAASALGAGTAPSSPQTLRPERCEIGAVWGGEGRSAQHPLHK